MKEPERLNPPAMLKQIRKESERIGFSMPSDLLTGSLLRTLAASKTAGQLLEIGTGTGLATAWLLGGMDRGSRLITIDQDAAVASVAEKHLGGDPRVTFFIGDAGRWLAAAAEYRFDLIFADAWPGKYSHLEEALGLLKVGGMYVIDDMLPQPNWPEGHAVNVARLVASLEGRSDLLLTKMEWSTGVIVATKVAS